MSQAIPTDECSICGKTDYVDDMQVHPNFTHPTAVCEECYEESWGCSHEDEERVYKLMNFKQGKYIQYYNKCMVCDAEWGHYYG